jgi:hypothetical protein
MLTRFIKTPFLLSGREDAKNPLELTRTGDYAKFLDI